MSTAIGDIRARKSLQGRRLADIECMVVPIYRREVSSSMVATGRAVVGLAYGKSRT